MIDILRVGKMAPERKEPPDKASEVFFKCHPKGEVTTVVCVICDSAYHQSCIKRKSVCFVSDKLMICQEHKELTSKLTSKFDESELSETARAVIAQIKLRQSEEIRKEILEELANKSQILNTTITDFASEWEHVTKENELLKQLNKELEEKNDLLRDKIKYLNMDQASHVTKTYAEVTNNVKPERKRLPKVIVKSSTGAVQSEVKNRVTECLTNDKNIQTKDIYLVKNKEDIVIKCTSEDSVLKTEKLLRSKLDGMCEIKIEKLNNPKVKIVGLDNCLNMDITDIEDDVNLRNFSNFGTKAKVLHMYTNSKTNLTSVLMEVSSELYIRIRNNNNKIYIGCQCCRVYDSINTKPCYNCGRFGHNRVKCDRESTCLKCAQNHTTKECTNTTLTCLNCSYSNKTYNTRYHTNHEATDSNSCSILKNKIKKYIDATDYPLKPVLPTTKPDSPSNSSTVQRIHPQHRQQNEQQQKQQLDQQQHQLQEQQRLHEQQQLQLLPQEQGRNNKHRQNDKVT